ncbi:DMT family transporter [bacterium]|nr:DMT family transporter [bacterium]
MTTGSKAHIVVVWIVIAVLASSAAILTRYCGIPAASIGFWRVFGAAVILMPFCLRARLTLPGTRLLTKGAILAGVFLGLHFATWCWSIQHTTIANASLFIGVQPLIAPFIAHFLTRDRLNRWEYVAVALATAGMVWLFGGQMLLSRKDLAGTGVALLSAVLCATYFVLGRRYRASQHILLFSVGVYVTAAAVQALGACVFEGGIRIGAGYTPLALLGLILLPTVGGHTLAMYLLRHVKPQVVVFSVPSQFVLTTVAAVPLFGEAPSLWFYPGAALIVSGVVLGIAKAE